MGLSFGPRRGTYVEIDGEHAGAEAPLSEGERTQFEAFDLVYRSLCAPALQLRRPRRAPGRLDLLGAGRRGGALRRDRLRPRRPGPRGRRPHLPTRPATRPWACTRCGRCATSWRRIGAPRRCCPRTWSSACASRTSSASAATPSPPRRCSGGSAPRPSTATRRRRLRSCGSPPAPPASASPARSGWPSAPRDRYGADAPRVHIVEGEGGLTPGRVAEALAAAGTASPRQRRSCTSTGTRRRSTPTASAARASARATTCSGTRGSCSTCTTGT